MRVNAGVHWKQISSKKKKSLSYCSLPCHHILWNLRSNEIMITVVFTVIVTIVIRMLILSYHLPSWYHFFSPVSSMDTSKCCNQWNCHKYLTKPSQSRVLVYFLLSFGSCLDFTVCFYICLNSYCFILPLISSQVAYPLFLPLFLPLEMGSEEARKRCKGRGVKQTKCNKMRPVWRGSNILKWCQLIMMFDAIGS